MKRAAFRFAKQHVDRVTVIVNHVPLVNLLEVVPWSLAARHVPETLGAHVVSETVDVAKVVV